MPIAFQIKALPYRRFERFFSMNDAELAAYGIKRMKVDANPGFPCRVSLLDAELDETVLALSFTHHDVDSPYRSSGPIFVRDGAHTAAPGPGTVPAMMRHRRLSIRGYDRDAMMIQAENCHGHELEVRIRRFFEVPQTAYLHIHNAEPGCFVCSVIAVAEALDDRPSECGCT